MKMKQVSFTQFMTSTIASLEVEERWSTARVYAASLRAVTAFVGGGEVFFSALTPQWLKRFETYLRDRQRKWNTVSTYIRALRATYNRGVDDGIVAYFPRLFVNVHTGVQRDQKQALPASQMHLLIYAPACQPLTAAQEQSREWLQVMFQLQGMPFVDLAHLRHSDYDADKRMLTCHRQKTGTKLSISLTTEMVEWIEQHRKTNREASPYLLPILTGGLDSYNSNREYQQQLARMNRNLRGVAQIQEVNVHVSSCAARHTWATLAKHCNIPEGLISEALGYTSVKTMEIYLKCFDNRALAEYNGTAVGVLRVPVTL